MMEARPLPRIRWPGTKHAMIAVASSQIGYREGDNNDTFFGRWYGMNHAPWCAMFISWAAFTSGNRLNIPKHAYTPSGAQWFQSRGRWGQKPVVGALAYYDVSGLNRISHVGLVDQVFPDGSWTSIEGNTNAAGSREGRVVRRQKRRTVGERGGFGYPKYVRAPRRWTVYEVRSGDTLNSLAQRHGTSVERLVKVNGLGDPNKIRVGQTIRVPRRGGASS